MTIEHLVWFLLIGLVAGWLAGVIVKGGGFGIVGDLIVGVLGALIGGWIFSQIGITAYTTFGAVMTALVGAIVFLGLIRLIKHA